MYLGGGEPNEYEKGLYERAWVEEGKQAAKLAARISELEAEVLSLREENAKLRGAREILSDAQQQLAEIVDAIVAERTQRAGEHK